MNRFLIALLFAFAPGTASARTVTVATHIEADRSHTTVHEVVVDAPRPEVWRAISTAEGWAGWATPVAWLKDDILETSYAPSATSGDPSTIRQLLTARIPGRLLAFRTVKAPEKFPHFGTYKLVSTVIELEPQGARRTRVRLTQVGYPDTPAGRQLMNFFREGNRVTLERLRRRFASGRIDWAREPR